MDNTIQNIADEIIVDLDNDSSLSSSFVQQYLIGNIGKLNNAIGSNIIVDCSGFNPLPTDDEKDILKFFFICQYYANLAKNSLGAAAFSFISVKESDTEIRTVSKNDLAKSYNEMSKQCKESLKETIKFYRQNKALPRSASAYDSNSWLYSRIKD